LLKITHEQARDALQRSGHLLEYRVEAVLRKRRYVVQSNQAYPDPITGKGREPDVSAIIAEQVGPDGYDYLFPVWLVECVNNPQQLRFFQNIHCLVHGLLTNLNFPALGCGYTWMGKDEMLRQRGRRITTIV
jgi:hypothetical protein